MAGVGEQRHRAGDEPVDRFDDDEAKVERDADREGAAEVGRVDMIVGMAGAHRGGPSRSGRANTNAVRRSDRPVRRSSIAIIYHPP